MRLEYMIGGKNSEVTVSSGTATWHYEYEDGTGFGVNSDSPHPLDMLGVMPEIDKSDNLNEVKISFSLAPDSFFARRWIDDYIGKAQEYAGSYEAVDISDNTILLSKGHVYEVNAIWPQGNANYAFYVKSDSRLESNQNIISSEEISITFPANTDDGAIELTEFNAHIYEIKPFDLALALPDGWSTQQWPLAGWYDFISFFSRLNFFNEKKECVGVVGYNIYELYEGAEDVPQAIYNQIALGNDYHFDVRDSYNVVNETASGTTAIADIYYAAVINDGAEKINKGIVSYNKDFLVYIAIEIASDKITDEQLINIAKSIKFARNEYHGLTKEEYEDLQAQKAKYEAMTDEQKQIAREGGNISCVNFIHLWWEALIEVSFIRHVGEEAFDEWVNQQVDSSCISIYSFADAFNLDFDMLKTIIMENHLEEIYPLDRLEARYNYFH